MFTLVDCRQQNPAQKVALTKFVYCNEFCYYIIATEVLKKEEITKGRVLNGLVWP